MSIGRSRDPRKSDKVDPQNNAVETENIKRSAGRPQRRWVDDMKQVIGFL